MPGARGTSTTNAPPVRGPVLPGDFTGTPPDGVGLLNQVCLLGSTCIQPGAGSVRNGAGSKIVRGLTRRGGRKTTRPNLRSRPRRGFNGMTAGASGRLDSGFIADESSRTVRFFRAFRRSLHVFARSETLVA